MTSHSQTASTEMASAPRRRMFHGWKVSWAGSIIQALHAALVLQAFGNYAVILREQFGWSRTIISIAYASNRAESGLLGPLHGWALARFGSKRVMRVGAVTLTCGFAWFSQITTPVQFVLSFFAIAVGTGLAGFMTIMTETVKWFERKRARALSMVQLGLAVGAFATPAVVLALRHLGWRETAVASGVVMGAVVFGLSFLFGSSPGERGVPLDGIATTTPAATGRTTTASARHLTAYEAMRTSAFWFLALGHMSALLVVGSVIAHLALYLTSEQGFTLQGASFVAASIPIAQIAGMVVVGIIGDRTSKRLLCSLAMVGHVTGLLLLTYATGRWMVWAFVVLHGLAWGMRGPLMAAIRADYFGATSFGQIMGYTSVILMFGAVGGPLLAGILAEATGDYRIGFTILALLAATGSALFAFARPPQVAREPEVADGDST